MRALFVLVLVLATAACGAKARAPNDEASGGPGAICACNDREPECVAVTCQSGLSCGYPCGIPGCHSVCMTAAELEDSKNRP